MINLVSLAFLVDLLLGDPRWLPHPVTLIGRAAAWLEQAVRGRNLTGGPGKGEAVPLVGGKRALQERLLGILVAVLVVGGSYWLTWLLITVADRQHFYLGQGVRLYFLWTALAVKSMRDHALAVLAPLQAGDLAAARQALGRIVGRDTEHLDAGEISRATVETVAEGTLDGVVAPLCFAFAGGAPLAMAYKAANTLDSQFGYKNRRYFHFGWAAARLDDALNCLPARLTVGLMVLGAALLGHNPRRVAAAVARDARKHPSPNAGLPEAAMAGALGVRLGGFNRYGGQEQFRPYLGEALRPLAPDLIPAALQLMLLTACLAVVLGLAATLWAFWLVGYGLEFGRLWR